MSAVTPAMRSFRCRGLAGGATGSLLGSGSGSEPLHRLGGELSNSGL